MLDRIFSGSAADLGRWSAWGLVVMALGVAACALAGRLSRGSEKRKSIIKIAGLLITALGALLTIKVI